MTVKKEQNEAFPTLVHSFELVMLIVSKLDFTSQNNDTEFSAKGPFSSIRQIFHQVAKFKPRRGKNKQMKGVEEGGICHNERGQAGALHRVLLAGPEHLRGKPGSISALLTLSKAIGAFSPSFKTHNCLIAVKTMMTIF